MDYHARTFYVEGIDMGKERFVWNDKLMFMDARTKNGNIAEVHIFLERPIPNLKKETREGLNQYYKDDMECMHLLSIFLACFKLSNNKPNYPKINRSMHGGHPLKSKEDFKNHPQNRNPFLNTMRSKEPVKDNIRDLKNSIPLFEKVLKNVKFEKQQKNPLGISLPIFERINSISIESVIDYSTVLESLVCENEGELKYKFALRTSLLVESDYKKRKEIFDFLKNIYKIRSGLVHGSEVSLEMFSREHANLVLALESIVRCALREYIELTYSGLSKKEIIEKLDAKALGMHDDQ